MIDGPTNTTCAVVNCDAVAIPGQVECLAHADAAAAALFFSSLSPGAEIVARGLSIDNQLMSELINSVLTPDGLPLYGPCDFRGAKFKGSGWFINAQFGGEAHFSDAEFFDDAFFQGCQFDDTAHFDGSCFHSAANFLADFKHDAQFNGAVFEGEAHFDSVDFRGYANFDGATFVKAASFAAATFHDYADFRPSTFGGWANFGRTEFRDNAAFQSASFAEDVDFDQTRFLGRRADFDGATFHANELGPAVAVGTVSFDTATFERSVDIRISSPLTTFTGTRFNGGARLMLHGGDAELDRAQFARPSILMGESDADQAGTPGPRDAGTHPMTLPRILSMRHADAANLLLFDVDLRECRFAGASGLDRLKLQGRIVFPSAPKHPMLRWRLFSRLPVTQRRTIAEEHLWRSAQEPRRNWQSETGGLVFGEVLRPEDIAVIYRALRKAQEDEKNEPGAADFYYGEMEMRRLAQETPSSEKAIIASYAVVSGYGLRGIRAALLYLLSVLVLGGIAYLTGFSVDSDRPSLATSWLYATEWTLGIPNSASLTTAGEAVRIGLRILGPLFLGLFLLSLRNRVKR